MSWIKHKTKTNRKLITSQEWAEYVGVSRQTVSERLYKYDPRDIYSVLDFFKFLLNKH